MSLELLLSLRDEHTFDPSPAAGRLAQLHVPFDQLLGQAHYENALASAVQRGERVALIGASGSGKSSITGHVLGQGLVSGVAAIQVRVAIDDPAVTCEPTAFARHVVRTVARHLDLHDTGRTDRRRARHAAEEATLGQRGRAPVHVGVSGGMPWLGGQLATDLGGIARLAPTGQDVIDQARTVLQIISEAGMRPVLVIDDTDHWLVTPGSPDPGETIAGFFGPVVRSIAEDLSPAAAVIAIHDSYLTHPSYQSGKQFLETPVTLPPLPASAQLAGILEHRASVTLKQQVPLGHFLADDALDRLWVNYSGARQNLRQVVRYAHGAVVHACDSGSPLVSAVHVDQAID